MCFFLISRRAYPLNYNDQLFKQLNASTLLYPFFCSPKYRTQYLLPSSEITGGQQQKMNYPPRFLRLWRTAPYRLAQWKVKLGTTSNRCIFRVGQRKSIPEPSTRYPCTPSDSVSCRSLIRIPTRVAIPYISILIILAPPWKARISLNLIWK